MKVFSMYVHLASDEWGNELMLKVATEILNDPAHKEHQPLVVTVYEHGGWFLSYALLDGEVSVVGTANDAASFTGKKAAFREKVRSAEWQYLPEIRRKKTA